MAPWLHRVACRSAARLKVSTNGSGRSSDGLPSSLGKPNCEGRDDWGRPFMKKSIVFRSITVCRSCCAISKVSPMKPLRVIWMSDRDRQEPAGRGRRAVRRRLVRRGIASSAAAIVPALLIQSQSRQCYGNPRSKRDAISTPGRMATAGAFSASVTALSEGVLEPCYLTQDQDSLRDELWSLVSLLPAWGSGLVVGLPSRGFMPGSRRNQAKAKSKSLRQIRPRKPIFANRCWNRSGTPSRRRRLSGTPERRDRAG